MFDKSRYMEQHVISGLSALAQGTRLQAFRLLVKHEPHGLPAGEIARALDVPQNTLSSHLSVLAKAGLATSTRQATTITYRANLAHLSAVIGFLLKDCCAGRAEICAPLIADLTSDTCETC
jgi:ArsR family transcriptional regulator, arsenate/arsenite/antimonite-responsive transcriptional repressor